MIPQDKKVKNIEDIKVVVRNYSQIGWCELPPFFCKASETARNVINTLLHEVNLPDHPFGEQMIEYKTENPRHRLTTAITYTNLVEVFVDNFIVARNNPFLPHPVTRNPLHIPPLPTITRFHRNNITGRGNMGHNEGSIGVAYQWRKFHATADAIQMQKNITPYQEICKLKYCKLKQFQELAGKLQQTSFGIPTV